MVPVCFSEPKYKKDTESALKTWFGATLQNMLKLFIWIIGSDKVKDTHSVSNTESKKVSDIIY